MSYNQSNPYSSDTGFNTGTGGNYAQGTYNTAENRLGTNVDRTTGHDITGTGTMSSNTFSNTGNTGTTGATGTGLGSNDYREKYTSDTTGVTKPSEAASYTGNTYDSNPAPTASGYPKYDASGSNPPQYNYQPPPGMPGDMGGANTQSTNYYSGTYGANTMSGGPPVDQYGNVVGGPGSQHSPFGNPVTGFKDLTPKKKFLLCCCIGLLAAILISGLAAGLSTRNRRYYYSCQCSSTSQCQYYYGPQYYCYNCYCAY